MTIEILVNIVFFFGMGLCALVRPSSVVSFVDFVPQSSSARNEVRAVYGGFGIAIALLLWAAAYQEGLRAGILLTVAGALLGMAGGRVVSLFIEKPGFWPIFFIFMEVGLAGLLLMAIDWSSVGI